MFLCASLILLNCHPLKIKLHSVIPTSKKKSTVFSFSIIKLFIKDRKLVISARVVLIPPCNFVCTHRLLKHNCLTFSARCEYGFPRSFIDHITFFTLLAFQTILEHFIIIFHCVIYKYMYFEMPKYINCFQQFCVKKYNTK